MRDDMKRRSDYVLIDSRTGLSDVADVCSIELPDVLTVCFTLSDQSIEGATNVTTPSAADSTRTKHTHNANPYIR